jgi:hypothetical protein
MPEIFNLLGKPYKYRRCVLSDIGRHFQEIKHWIPEGEKEEFQRRMANSIHGYNAWCTENTFLYYESTTPGIALGVALYGQKYPQELIALFMGVFSRHDKVTHALKFKLHPGKFMSEYAALLTKVSMKRASQDPDHPVLVRIDHLKSKFFKIIKTQGLVDR